MVAAIRSKVKNVVFIDGEDICHRCGSPKVLNLALLGAAVASGKLGITTDELKNAIMKRIPSKYHKMNLQAVSLAAEEVN